MTHATDALAVLATLELLVIGALAVMRRSRTSERERLLQRDNERLQAANTNLLDRTMHVLEKTWTPAPAEVAELAPQLRDDDEKPDGLLSFEEVAGGLHDDEIDEMLRDRGLPPVTRARETMEAL